MSAPQVFSSETQIQVIFLNQRSLNILTEYYTSVRNLTLDIWKMSPMNYFAELKPHCSHVLDSEVV